MATKKETVGWLYEHKTQPDKYLRQLSLYPPKPDLLPPGFIAKPLTYLEDEPCQTE